MKTLSEREECATGCIRPLLPALVLDVRGVREAGLEVAVGDAHVVARILLGGIAQRLEVPWEMAAVLQRLEQHVPRLLAFEHLAVDARNVELGLDLGAE